MMKALNISHGELSYRSDYKRPFPLAGEALIRIRLAGICSTDLEIVKGYAGFEGVLGHEFVGQVESVANEADRAWIGRRVVATINGGCGTCRECTTNGPEHCPTRTALGIHGHDGVFAEYVTWPVANLLEVPETVADETAVFTEPLAAALRIPEQIKLSPSDRAAVIGPGRLGLLIAQVLKLKGLNVTVLGRSQKSLQLPAALGLTTGLTNEFADDSFKLVVEATGNESGLIQSLRLVRPLGTLVLKSTFQGKTCVNLTKLVVSEISVIGSRCGPFEPALRLLAQNDIRVHEFIDAEYRLKDGLAAFEHAARPGTRKILLRP